MKEVPLTNSLHTDVPATTCGSPAEAADPHGRPAAILHQVVLSETVPLPRTAAPAADIEPSTESDAERHARFKRDVGALEPEVRAFARLQTARYPDPVADGEDVAQEALLKAWRFFHTFRPGTNLRAWLFTIVRNTAINLYRSRACRPESLGLDLHDDGDNALLDAQLSTHQVSAERAALEAIGDPDIHKALSALPEARRTAVYLCDIAGFSYDDIADAMGTPIGTVMSRLHRGRKELRQQLHGVAVERGFIRGERGVL